MGVWVALDVLSRHAVGGPWTCGGPVARFRGGVWARERDPGLGILPLPVGPPLFLRWGAARSVAGTAPCGLRLSAGTMGRLGLRARTLAAKVVGGGHVRVLRTAGERDREESHVDGARHAAHELLTRPHLQRVARDPPKSATTMNTNGE